MKIYILQAKGLLACFNGSGKILCKYAFKNKEDAENYGEIFKSKCIVPIDDCDWNYLKDDENLIINIIELELK